MKTLRTLIESVPSDLWISAPDLDGMERSLLETPISSLTPDSRKTGPDTIFFAHTGQTRDGHQYVREILEKTCPCALGEKELESPGLYLRVKNSRLAQAALAAALYDHPSRSMKMIAITGTSGKTTTSYLVESILKHAGLRTGMIGTIQFRFEEMVFPATHTTPDSPDLQKILFEMKKNGCEAIVMEVSSHALKQLRADFIAFDVMAFTNLSPEHLDYHPDMEDYFNAKKRLFTDFGKYSTDAGKNPAFVINRDDDYGKRLDQELRFILPACRRITCSIRDPRAEIRFLQPGFSFSGIRGRIQDQEIQSNLLGTFNADNILSAFSICSALGIPPAKIPEGIGRLTGVPGRLETVPNGLGFQILVDYAHKPDALTKVLQTLKEIPDRGRIITVFGCGGDRDKSKRPLMGQIALEHSDLVFITSDNPRTEDPKKIIGEILQGIHARPELKTPYQVEEDRKRAIEQAIGAARSRDIVLLAGKGHEDYQIIADPDVPQGTMKIPFDDKRIALGAAQYRKSSASVSS